MQQQRLSKIELKTRDILEQVLGPISEIEPPINLAKILQYFDLSLSTAIFKKPEAAGALDKTQKMIYLAKGESQKRQFFTVAHEIGHFALNHKKKFDVFYRQQITEFNGESSEEEREANYFAASILMPKELVLKFWQDRPDVELVSSFFGVSRSAAFWRLKNLGLIE
jgi:Zn-dependent peptidase ImmA (M78 family)